ncbi:hypothetical protein [Nitrosomonas marina]|nr:hypothetical protein [Nitrosomonas marina]
MTDEPYDYNRLDYTIVVVGDGIMSDLVAKPAALNRHLHVRKAG